MLPSVNTPLPPAQADNPFPVSAPFCCRMRRAFGHAQPRSAGIRSRHVLSEGESLSQHASAAAQRALAMAGVPAADVDIVLLATSSPDDIFGSASQARPG